MTLNKVVLAKSFCLFLSLTCLASLFATIPTIVHAQAPPKIMIKHGVLPMLQQIRPTTPTCSSRNPTQFTLTHVGSSSFYIGSIPSSFSVPNTYLCSITNANSFDVDILSEVNDTILNMPANTTVTEDDVDPTGSQNYCTGCTFFQELFGIRYLGFGPILPHELSAVSQMAADKAINPLSLGRTFASD
jgi:hypothetical protein